MPRLIVVQGARHRSHTLRNERTVVGALPESDILVDDPEVSKRHMTIERRGERYFVADAGSRNGTWLNEARVEDATELHSGDRLRIGQTALFFLEADRLEMSTDGRAPERPRGDKLGNLLILQEINKALNSESDLERLLELIMDTAIHLCDAERGFLILVNEAKLDFVVARNIDYEAVRSPEFKISNSVIRRVVKSGEPILTSNAKVDLKSVDSVISLDVRSLLCVPLRVKSRTIGTLYLDSRQAGAAFSEEDRDLLSAFSDQAAIALENARLLKEAKDKEAILSELRVARTIQLALLPKRDPLVPGFDLAGGMKTAKEVGGDYYDYIPAHKNQDGSRDLFLAIGDVSGKGVPAGLIMVMARSTVRSLSGQRDVDPKAVCVETNRILKQDLKPGLFMSLLLARADLRTGSLRLAGCGHERPLIRRASGKVERVDLGGLVLGVVADNAEHVAEMRVVLEPGDLLLLYTDGVTEAMDPRGKLYGLPRLEGLLMARGHEPPLELLHAIEADVSRHAQGAEQHDDITLIALRRKATGQS
ncbi:SpoIIE family protein phosphatase [bacterium]|nr:SpoIIE family protein phosphatase [bacterium]